jgi:hypothetical protein
VLSGHRFASSALAALAVACGAGAAAAPGCGTPSRPPDLSDYANEAGTAFFVNDASPGVASCNLGPNGNVCACVDQPLGQVPNLYFVLDRSGSMNDDNKWNTIVNVVTTVVLELGPRVNVGVAVFPNPAAGPDTCATGDAIVPLSRGDVPSRELGPTASAIFKTLGSVGAQGGTPTAATLTGLMPLLKTFPGKTYVVLATDGGPNCNPNATCGAAQCQLDIEATPGCATNTNCCAGPGGALNCLDAEPTTFAVQALANNDFPVYVVGVPGSAPYATLLDALATAGGTARDANGPGPQYYDVATTDEPALQAALFQIAGKIAGNCQLTLDAVPPDPNLVNVFIDEQPLATGAGCVDPGALEGGAEASMAGGAEAGGAEASMPGGAEAGADAISSSESGADVGTAAANDAALETTPESEGGFDATFDAADSDRDEASVVPSTYPSTCNWVLQGQTVTILGDTCEKIMAGDVLDVRVVAGCPTVIQ